MQPNRVDKYAYQFTTCVRILPHLRQSLLGRMIFRRFYLGWDQVATDAFSGLGTMALDCSVASPNGLQLVPEEAHSKSFDARPKEAPNSALEQRVGRVHLQQRLGLETEHEAHMFGPGLKFFHRENWYSVHSVIRNALRLAGLHRRSQRNTLDIRVRYHDIALGGLPEAFEGYTLLQISDLHVDMHPDATRAVVERVQHLSYDLCVLTGDYRAKTFGSYAATLEGMKTVRRGLKGPLYGILGNHDTIRLVPELEEMGIRILLNESVVIERGLSALYLAGIDDAHHYRLHNIEKAAEHIPAAGVAILLSHTPEPYRQAAHSGFKVMLCGHTHGGQICLPGGYPILWDAACPRALVAGRWRHGEMVGYTSVGAGTSVVRARLNCPPEVTLHRLRAGA